MRTILLTALVSAALLVALGYALPAGAYEPTEDDPAASLDASARILCERKGYEPGSPAFRQCYDDEVMRLTVERAERIRARGGY
jgi:hypothetical protein